VQLGPARIPPRLASWSIVHWEARPWRCGATGVKGNSRELGQRSRRTMVGEMGGRNWCRPSDRSVDLNAEPAWETCLAFASHV
jgi:hypothetical protein